MIKTYINEIINEFDQEFESLVIPFPEQSIFNEESIFQALEKEFLAINDNKPAVAEEVVTASEEDSAAKLKKIEALATELSAERYSPNYNPEVCLANLLNFILSKNTDPDYEEDIFQLLNQERNVDLNEALNDFDFYLDNPYKVKAEKILSKLEAKKNK